MATEKIKATLYWLEQSRSQRILWLLEELKDKIDYDVKTFNRVNQLAPPELKKIHPLGKSPVLTLQIPGQTEPLVLAESAFITEYLIEHFAPHLQPERYQAGKEGKVGGETESWLRYRYFLQYAEGSLMPFLVMKLVTLSIRNQAPFIVKPITNRVAAGVEEFVHPNIENHLQYLNDKLASSPNNGKYICGDKLTGADILLSFPILAVKGRFGVDKKKLPALAAYMDLLEKEPGYIAAVKEIEKIDGKPYEISG